MEAEEAIVHVAGSTPGHGSNSDSTSGLPQTEPLELSTPQTGTLIGSSDAEHDEASEAASLLHGDMLSKASSVGADAPLAATPANPVLAPLSPPGNGPLPLGPSAASAEPDKAAQRGNTCAYICVICTGIVAAVVFVGFIAAALYRGVHYGGAVTDVGPVLSSPTDDRSFSYIQLENGLQAMLISDPDAESAAAALDVRVGSWYDPKTFPGLAHMVEHGLFLGTLPYPGENEYNAYLASNGGSSNAYTDLEDTNYFFSVAAGGLEGALDRFAQFFIAPTFNDSSMARELKAVDSEHRKNLQSDTWRRYQLLKHVSSPDTPFNSFSTGDLETLNKPGVRAAMLAFHAAHYAAPRMRLAVVGNQPLDTLAEWVAGKFSPIASVPRTFKFAPAPAGSSIAAGGEAEVVVVTDSAVIKRSSSATGSGNPTDLYATVPASQLRAAIADVNATGVVGRASNETLAPERVFPPSSSRGVRLLVSPIADAHKMTAYFPLPAQATAYAARVGALSFITSVLGDEGAGSPLSYLKAAGLGESVSAGEEVDSTGFALMAIDVTISPAVVDAARAAGSPAAAAAVLTAASDRILAVLFAHVRLVTQELETAISQSIAALRKTGNVDLLCGAGTHPTLNLTQMTAEDRANSGAAHLTSAGATTDALGICRDHRGRLVQWPGNAATSAAYRVWADAQHMALLQFRYPSKGDPSRLASHLAKAMHRAGPNDILTPPCRRVWQPRAIHLMLQHIVPSNALVLISSKVLDASLLPQTEPIYGSRYDMQPLPPATLAALAGADPLVLLPAGSPRPHLALPLTNPFLPSDFSLVRHGDYASALGLADIDAIAASQPVGGPGGPLSVAGAMGAALGQEHMRSSDSSSGTSSVVGVAGAAGRISQQRQQGQQHVHQAQLPHSHAAAGARFAQRRAAGAESRADADANAGAEGSGAGAASGSSSGSGSGAGAGAEEGESISELLSDGEGEGNDASEAQSHSQSSGSSSGGRSTVVIEKAGSSGSAGSSGRSSGSGAVVRAAGSEPQTDSRIGAPKASDDAAAVAARLRAMLLPINDMLPALGLAPPAPVPSPAPKVKGKAAAAPAMPAAEQEHWGVGAQLTSLGGPAPTPGASPAPPSSSTTSSTPAAVITGYAAGYTPPISLWWMPDAFFGRPRSYMVLEITAPAAAASAAAHILSVLYVAALRDALREVGYAAARGGTSFAVTSLSFASGISFSVESYSQVMPRAVDAMLPRLLAANGTAGRASADLKLLVQGLRNGAKEQPYSRALQQLDVLTGARRFTTAQLLAAAASVAGVSSEAAAAGEFTVPNPSALAAAVTSHAQALWADARTITLFVYGNENTTTARALGGHALARLMDSPLLQPFRARASAGAGAGSSGGGSTSGGSGSAAAAAHAPSAVVPAESFVEVRSLPPGGRTALLMHGENPDDVNSAAVTAFQVGLRDTCGVTAPPVQLIGQAATPPASAAAAIAAAKAIGQGTAGHAHAGGGPRSLHKSGAAGAGAAGKSPAPSPSSHPTPSPSAAAPAASPSGAPGVEKGKDGGDDGSGDGDEYRSSGKGKDGSASKTAAGADAGAAAAVAHGAARHHQQQRRRQRDPQPLPQSFLQLAERARAAVVSAGAAAARVLAPAAASPDEMRAAVLTASGAVANLQVVPAAAADAATAAQPAHAAAAAGHAAGGKAAKAAAASTALSQDALDAALVKEFRRRRSAARRVFEGWEHGLSDAAAAAVAADTAAAAGNKAAAVAAGGVTASLGSASSASSAGSASAAFAALASASAAAASSQGRTLASFSDAELTAAAAELDRDCDVRNAALDMLEQLVRDPAFTELRTQRQLGYIVFGIARHADSRLPDAAVVHRPVTALTFGGYDAHAASPVGAPTSAAAAAAAAATAHLDVNASTAGHGRFAEGALSVGAVSRAALGDSMQSLVVLVQGAAAGADVMDDAIAAFSYHFEAFLRSMDAATWMAAVNGVRSVARRLPVSMSEAFLWEWEEIGRRSFRSSRRVDEAKALRRVTMAHVLALYRRVMHPDAGARIATVDVFGKSKTLAAPTGAGAPTFLLERTR